MDGPQKGTLSKSIGCGKPCSWSKNNQHSNLSFDQSLYIRAILQNSSYSINTVLFTIQGKTVKVLFLKIKTSCAQAKQIKHDEKYYEL